MHTMDSITGLLTLLLLYVCYKWSDSADRHCTTRQRLIRSEARIADLQDQLRCRHADIERLESQVSSFSDALTEAQTGPVTTPRPASSAAAAKHCFAGIVPGIDSNDTYVPLCWRIDTREREE
jgi:hypothetical protein